MGELRLNDDVRPLRQETLARFAGLLEQRLGHGRSLRRSWALERRLRELMQAAGGCALDPEGFVDLLAEARHDSPLSRALFDIAPNQETWFFRDASQLEAICRLVPHLGTERRVRILSMGCATGEEIYSLAILLAESGQLLGGRELELWGVDVSPGAIEQARVGAYRPRTLERAEEGPPGWRERYLRDEGALLQIRPSLRDRIRFAVGNLVDPASLVTLGSFDLILCRNVLIYFEDVSLQRASTALVSLLRPGGAMALGRAEIGAVAPTGLTARPIGEGLWTFFREEPR